MFNDLITKIYLIEKRRQFSDFDSVFPKQIDLETTNACNIHCSICPQPNQKRKPEHMKFELAKKAIDEINNYGLEMMCLTDFGEPFLNKEFFEISRYAARSAKIKHLFISTNGLLIDRNVSEQLLTSGLDKIIVSLDGACKETYERIRIGSDYDKVVHNILDFIEMRRKHNKVKPSVAVQIIRMHDTVKEIDDFLRFWKSRIDPQDQIDIKEYIGWQYQVPYRNSLRENKIKIRVPCLVYLWSNLAIHSNGNICACCYDLNGELILGNIKENSIYDIWHGKKCRQLRFAHLKGLFKNIPVCENCEFTHRKFTIKELLDALTRRIFTVG